MRKILDSPTRRVNHRTLKDRQAEVFREEIKRGHTVAITNNQEIDGYLVPPKVYDEAREALEGFSRMRAAIPLMIAAARTGIAIPSVTFEALGIEIPFDWRALNEFQARFPVALTHTEDGAPMPELPTGLEQQHAEEEADEELIVVE